MKRGREEDNCLMLLTKVGETEISDQLRDKEKESGAFKCKTCNRRFTSFQALGGHRASHKKPKLMFSDLSCHYQLPSLKPRMHPCPICGLEFSIGQALGGHMRKHRVVLNDDSPILKKKSEDDANSNKRLDLCLDLNLNLRPPENNLKLDLRMPLLNCFI